MYSKGRTFEMTGKNEAEAKSRLHAVLIADIRGYTAYSSARGDAAARELVQEFQNRVLAAANSHAQLRFQRGDEALALFSSARSALKAAVELRLRSDGDVSIGQGLSVGDLMRVDDNYEGSAVIRASRLCAEARAGEALADERVVVAAGETEGVRCDLLGPRFVKGFAESLTVYSVVEERAPSRAPFRDRLLRTIAGWQERSDRELYLGMSVFGDWVQRDFGIDSGSEEGMRLYSSLRDAVEAGLVIYGKGGRYVQLSPAGWRLVRGKVPGSENDEELMNAIVLSWRDPGHRKPSPQWLDLASVFRRLNWPWDIYPALSAAGRLAYAGLIIVKDDMTQAVWVRPEVHALDAVRDADPAALDDGQNEGAS